MDIEESFENAFDRIVGFLPNLLAFLLILLVGYIIAKIVAAVVGKLLDKVGLDRRLKESDSARHVDAVLPGASVSRGIAAVVFWLIFIFFIVTAVGALGIDTATDFMNRVLAFLPNVIVALLIFVIAALLSGAVAGMVAKFMGDTPTGKVVATVVPALIMVIAFFMILEQLQIAPEIVRIAFAAVMFALALGLALAFGLGGRDVAARMLENAEAKAGDARRQAEQDMRTGKARAESEYGDHSSSSYTSTGSATTTTSAPTSTTDTPGSATQQFPPA